MMIGLDLIKIHKNYYKENFPLNHKSGSVNEKQLFRISLNLYAGLQWKL